jgi:hypothetical protein
MPSNTNPQTKVEANPPPPLPPPTGEPSQHSDTFPTHGTILTITRGSNTNFDTKRQLRDYYRQVNHVAIEGPITQTKWSHVPITFSSQDVNLASFPHTDAMVVTIHIDRCDVTKILIDNGSQAKILFLIAFEKMGYERKQLKEPIKTLYGFGGKRIEPVGVITPPMSFNTLQNPHTEYITFDVVDMLYPYNAIFGRGLLNTFKAALHSGYLCLKIPATFGVIPIVGNQQDARNIEKGFVPGHKNVYFLREEQQQHNTLVCHLKAKALAEYKKAIEADNEFKRVVCISTEASQQEQAEALAFLDKKNYIVAWSTFDLVGVSRDIIEHPL